MKAKPFKRAQVPDLAKLNECSEIPRAEVVALIVNGICRHTNGDQATMRGKISAKVGYDKKTGKLHESSSGHYRIGDIGAWANRYWPGQIEGLSRFGGKITGSVTFASIGASGKVYTPPVSMEEAIRQIEAYRARCAALRQDLTMAEDKVRELAVKANKWDHWNKVKGRRAPKKGAGA